MFVTHPSPTSRNVTVLDKTADAEPDERIDAARAAAIQGLPLSSFNAARRSMQLVRDRATGRLLPYPDYSRDALGNAASPEERRRQEVDFDASHVLVVPEWGGIRYPKGSWTYSLRMNEAIRDGHVGGLSPLAGEPRK